ncbi:hypothetical protein [Paraburkholderia fungorum]|uniref:Permuted papain-like amidase enzyme, YaeF/YiiX, C92 family n=1 Tax=Paraburkholderia fungorum TaxID=134537 RepID=A0A3R7IPJ0_9BURK|nr:hypothetical protein [Paraburkholderia fungorum]RKF49171.1 hypothetical protein BCY88_18865 [Paraburkholderia fungorum]
MRNNKKFKERDKRFKLLYELRHLQQPGDIIFIRNGSSIPMRLAQSMFCPSVLLGRHGGWKSIPSHVLIVVAPGLYLHSMPRGGVDFVPAEDYQLSSRALLKVVRRRLSPGEQKGTAHEALQRAAEWHFQQRYNYKVILTLWKRKLHSHSYCSQLVSQIYERANFPIANIPPRWTLPVNLQKACDGDEWIDVTEDHRRFEIGLASLPDADRPIFGIERRTVQISAQIQADMVDLQSFMETIHPGGQDGLRIPDIIKSLKRFIPLIAAKFKAPAVEDNKRSSASIDVNHHANMLYSLSANGLYASSVFSSVNHWNAAEPEEQKKRRDGEVRMHLDWCIEALAYCIAVVELVTRVFSHSPTDEAADMLERTLQSIAFSPELLTALSEAVEVAPPPPEVASVELIKLHNIWRHAAKGYIYLGAFRMLLLDPNNTHDVVVESDVVKQLSGLRWCWRTLKSLSGSQTNTIGLAIGTYRRMLADTSVEFEAKPFVRREDGTVDASI